MEVSRGLKRKHHDEKGFFQTLSQEMTEFSKCMRSTGVEHRRRIDAIDRMKGVILELWPYARVELFGSFTVGLHLPESDIDLVVLGKWATLPLETLAASLREKQVAAPDTLEVRGKAKVKIITLTERVSGLKFDISFNSLNGLNAAKYVCYFKRMYPTLQPLVLVLKQYLLDNDFNVVYRGGLSSYGLILMVIQFLQTHVRQEETKSIDYLGALIAGFFEFYGCKFDNVSTTISTRVGRLIPKENVKKQRRTKKSSQSRSLLSIEDPLNIKNDIGGGSYKIMDIQDAFKKTFVTLSEAANALESEEVVNQHARWPLLGKIIQINAEIFARHQSLEALRVSVPFEKSKLHGSPDQTPSSMTEESLDLTRHTASNGTDAGSVSVE